MYIKIEIKEGGYFDCSLTLKQKYKERGKIYEQSYFRQN